MRILVSNDDGILANGLRVLVEALGTEHDVYVVAPDRERSASGHSLTMHTPLRVEEAETMKGAKRCWATTGTPGDCVKIAVSAILSESEKPDLVISGINHGPNLGGDILYSGTVSCAMEGALMGIQSVAISLASLNHEIENFRVPAEFMLKLLKKLENYKIPDKTILNINVPDISKDDIIDAVSTELGGRMYTDCYDKRTDPRGKVYYWLAGELVADNESSKTDISAIRNNKISITPITYDMTRREFLDDLENELCCNIKSWF